MSVTSVTAVILAAGASKRFTPLATSKPLFPFFDQPITLHLVKMLKKAGFQKVLIVTNTLNRNILKKALGKEKSVQFTIQPSPKGMADALLSAKDQISGKSIFVINAEDMVDQKLFDMAFAEAKKQDNFIISKKQNEYFNGGYLQFQDNKLIGIVEKPGKGNEPRNLINLVFHYFSSADEFINTIKVTQSQQDDVYEKALSQIIKQTNVKVLKYDGYWQALKYSWNILDMTKLFLSHFLSPNNHADYVADSAHIDKNVYLGKGVKVLENAVIKEPSWIGDNTVVGTNSLVLESMIGKNCVIGFATEVTRSYLGENSWLHKNYIGDSVLEGDNYFGAGAVTANFRLDAGNIHSVIQEEKINTQKKKFGIIVANSARVGVNASLMPGVKIGPHSLIGPGVVRYSDVKPNIRILTQQSLKEKSI